MYTQKKQSYMCLALKSIPWKKQPRTISCHFAPTMALAMGSIPFLSFSQANLAACNYNQD